jgi:phage baseplate assembly protein V
MWGEIDKRINRALAAIRKPFRIVISGVNSQGGVQAISGTGLAGEPLRDLEHFQQFGFTSAPPEGAMGVAVPMGGKTSHSIVVATEHMSLRLVALNPGEVAIYSSQGAKVVIKQGRIVEVDCDDYIVNCKRYTVNSDEKADFNTPTVTMSQQAMVKGKLTGEGGMAISTDGDGPAMQIEGDLDSTGDIRSQGVSLPNHDHDYDGGVTEKANAT